MLSVVIPLLNEDTSLPEMHAEVVAAAERFGFDVEIIFVDDGSTDGSWETITALSKTDPRVRGIRLRTNFGKAAALTAGFRAARGEPILTMDADLQDDPPKRPNC